MQAHWRISSARYKPGRVRSGVTTRVGVPLHEKLGWGSKPSQRFDKCVLSPCFNQAAHTKCQAIPRYLRVWQTPNQPETQTQHTKEPPLQPPANGKSARRYSLPEPRRPAVRTGVTPATRPWGKSRGPTAPAACAVAEPASLPPDPEPNDKKSPPHRHLRTVRLHGVTLQVSSQPWDQARARLFCRIAVGVCHCS